MICKCCEQDLPKERFDRDREGSRICQDCWISCDDGCVFKEIKVQQEERKDWKQWKDPYIEKQYDGE